MNRLLLFLLIVFTIASCNQPDNKAPVNVVSKGETIAYDACGKGDTTLLFLHGWCINKDYWSPQRSAFCSRYKVVAIDLPGFGLSPGKNRSDWSFDNYADDVKAVIDQL